MTAKDMLIPLFHDPEFANLGAKSKKIATITIHLWLDAKNLMFTTKGQSKRQIIGYRHPQTGLFVTNLKNGEPQTEVPYQSFRTLATEYATQAVYDKIDQLTKFSNANPQDYASEYKPIDKIKDELLLYLKRKSDFYTQLQKEVDLLVQAPLPHVNEFLLYADDKVPLTGYYTKRLAYQNPVKQTLTDDQRELVDKFLDVFADDYNKRVIAWYFGAVLSNITLQDDRVSKVLIVSSAGGGSGKSTLFQALADGLLTKSYRVIDSGFDKHFRSNDKFNTSNLPTCRLGIYSEAYFNGDTSGENEHDFTGLDESEMKSWITDGYVANEQKYADKQISQLTGLQIILTNHPPKIKPDRTDLSRRFLSAVIKPSSMVTDKSNELNLHTANAVVQYVIEHAQAFANYFVHEFQTNQHQYQNVSYNTDEMEDELISSEETYNKSKRLSNAELKHARPSDVIYQLGKQLQLDMTDFITYLRHHQDDNQGPIRVNDKHLYLESSKQFYAQHHILPLRESLKDMYGTPKKVYHRRMFVIPLNQ